MIEKYSGAMEVILAATVMALLGLLGLFIGPFYFFAMLFLPLPLVYLILKRDLLYGLYSVILTALILLIAFNNFKSAGLLILQFVPLGLLIGLMFKNKLTVYKSMTVLFFLALLIAALNLLFSFVLSGTGISQVTEEFRVIMEQMAQFYNQNGLLDEANRQQYLDFTEQIIYLVQTLLPGNVAVWNIIMAMLTYFIAKHWMQKLGLIVADNFRFTKLQIPWYSIWLIIIGLVFTLLGDELSWQLMDVTGKNILYIAAFIFFVLGLAVILYYVQLWRISKVVKFFLMVCLLLYLPFTAAIAITIGMIDSVVDLRRQQIEDDGIKGD
ncbi:hypothetical protein SPSYN_00660 [Sporotomaculum syntrophicum]|uniref:DUF2232 domain-containing protein n=1 Tax=Sporotomaculum syntrophicum TaxID=182264 RepID=A0A9D2WRR9_9FIRM|nr:DUF2232 domain-containing protein [Sporotomaculum syntrophicum]KAF1085925.1 hypothetical protein SPSYN_00660 [Sporotomaculum syntrophicum]